MPIADIDYTEYITPEKIAAIKAVVEELDKDHSGVLNEAEVWTIFKRMGRNLTRQELRDVIKEVDVDGNGEIDFEELCVMEIKISRCRPRADRIKHDDYLDERTIAKLESLFHSRDTSKVGALPKEEVQKVIELAGTRVKDLDEFDLAFSEADVDRTGTLTLPQLCNAYVVTAKKRKKVNYREFLSTEQVSNMRSMFSTFDPQSRGSIGKKELDNLFKHCGLTLKRKQLRQLFEDFDSDGSGDIDFEEFCVMMLRLKSARRQREVNPRTCGCWPLWKNDTFSIKELQMSGFNLKHFREAGIPVGAIYKEGIFTVLDLRRAGYTPTELRRGGVGANELRSSGFSLADLKNAGFSDFSLQAANRSLKESLSSGDLTPLPQRRPYTSTSFLGSKKYPQFKPGVPCLISWDSPPRQMTPMIREHTDWLPPKKGPEGIPKPLEMRRLPPLEMFQDAKPPTEKKENTKRRTSMLR